MSAQAAAQDPEVVQFLRVRVGEHDCAIEVGRVSDIAETTDLTDVPGTADVVVGVGQLRGELTVVIDGAGVLGSGEGRATGSRAVALEREGGGTRLAIQVDDVDGLVDVHVDDISPDAPADLTSAAFKATATTGDADLGVVDVDYVSSYATEVIG
ncbi:MAG: chemotaxis protein CheW [Halorientalis sp.]